MKVCLNGFVEPESSGYKNDSGFSLSALRIVSSRSFGVEESFLFSVLVCLCVSFIVCFPGLRLSGFREFGASALKLTCRCLSYSPGVDLHNHP